MWMEEEEEEEAEGAQRIPLVCPVASPVPPSPGWLLYLDDVLRA